jgi:hypothetical protein
METTADRLGALVEHLSYDFKSRTGMLTIPELCCVDMDATISLFVDIDPQVKIIMTIAGEILDTTYMRRDETWTALPPLTPRKAH